MSHSTPRKNKKEKFHFNPWMYISQMELKENKTYSHMLESLERLQRWADKDEKSSGEVAYSIKHAIKTINERLLKGLN